MGACVQSHFSHVRLFVIPQTVAHQAPLSMEFSRKKYWSEMPFPPPGDLLDPGMELVSPVLAGGFFTTVTPGKLYYTAFDYAAVCVYVF